MEREIREVLILRADADAHIGTGHLMRCLALAQAWRDRGGRVVLITACRIVGLLRWFREENAHIVSVSRSHPDPSDWETTSHVLDQHTGAWVVLDGYHFDEDYQKRVKAMGHALLVIDDMAHLTHYYSDIVLNQNLDAESLNYPCEAYTRLLLGTRYVLLRREFLKWRGWQREIPEVARRVLITLGGGDPHNVTRKVLDSLRHVPVDGLEAVVIAGGANPHLASLEKTAKETPFPVRIETDVLDISEWMAWADVAIAGSGTTCWELAFMGLPSICLILAENQIAVAELLHEKGAAVNLGWHYDATVLNIGQALRQLLGDPVSRSEMRHHGKKLVDGEGVSRVVMHVNNERIRLRPALQDDCWLFWKWANDPEVRVSAFSSDPIPWQDHEKWFAKKIRGSNAYLFICFDDEDTPIGQIRFDITADGAAEVDVTIDKRKRGQGYGALLIKMGVQKLLRETSISTIHAFVKIANRASQRAFEKAGFKYFNTEIVRGHKAVHYVIRK